MRLRSLRHTLAEFSRNLTPFQCQTILSPLLDLVSFSKKKKKKRETFYMFSCSYFIVRYWSIIGRYFLGSEKQLGSAMGWRWVMTSPSVTMTSLIVIFVYRRLLPYHSQIWVRSWGSGKESFFVSNNILLLISNEFAFPFSLIRWIVTGECRSSRRNKSYKTVIRNKYFYI